MARFAVTSEIPWPEGKQETVAEVVFPWCCTAVGKLTTHATALAGCCCLAARMNQLHLLQTIVWSPEDKCRSLAHLTSFILHSIPQAPQRRGRPGQSFVGGSRSFLPQKPGIHCNGTFPKATHSRVGWRAWFPHEALTFPGVWTHLISCISENTGSWIVLEQDLLP